MAPGFFKPVAQHLMTEPVSDGEKFYGVGTQPPDIAAAAAEIRLGWSHADFYSKAGLPIPAWLADENEITTFHHARSYEQWSPPILRGA